MTATKISTEENVESDRTSSEEGSSNIQASSPQQRWSSSDGGAAAAIRESTTTNGRVVGDRFQNNDASNYNMHFATTASLHHRHAAAAAAAMSQLQPPPNFHHLSHVYQNAFFPNMMMQHLPPPPPTHHHHHHPRRPFNVFQRFPPQLPDDRFSFFGLATAAAAHEAVPAAAAANATTTTATTTASSSSSSRESSNDTSPPPDTLKAPQASSRQEELEEDMIVAQTGVELGEHNNNNMVHGVVGPQALAISDHLIIPPRDYEMPSMQNIEISNIVTPLENDVLCGRGGGANNWAGNEKFRILVKKQQFAYVKADKRDKPNVSLGVVRAVRAQNPPGRFLQRDETTGLWYDIGDAKAREKAAQALREGAPVIRCNIKKSKRASLPNNTQGDDDVPSSTMEQELRQKRYDKAAMVLAETAATLRTKQHHSSMLAAETMARAVSSASMGPNANTNAMTGGMNMMPPMHLMKYMPPAGMSFGHFPGFHFPPVPPGPLYHRQHQQQYHHAAADERKMKRTRFGQTSQQHNVAHPQATNDSSNPSYYHVDTSMPSVVTGGSIGTTSSEVEVVAGPAIITPRETSPTCTEAVDSRFASEHRNDDITANRLQKRSISEISDGGPPPQQVQQKLQQQQTCPAPQPDDISKRLVLAEQVTQRTCAGTLTHDLVEKEQKMHLYLDAGLLGVDPEMMATFLAQGHSEMEIVDHFYDSLRRPTTNKEDEQADAATAHPASLCDSVASLTGDTFLKQDDQTETGRRIYQALVSMGAI